MITNDQILSLIKDKIEKDGVFIVTLNVAAGNKIIVHLDSHKGISVDYCIQISRLIEHSFDREVEDFELEVSSPGIGQPFKVFQQYEKHQGKTVEVIGKDGIKTEGVLENVNETGFLLKIEKMVKPEGKKKKELQITERIYKFDDVKSTKEIISF